jgi:hypothetical protein
MEYDFNKNKSLSITREESEQLEREYEINDILTGLYKALGKVGGDTTITDAIEILSKETRFAKDVKKCAFGDNRYITGDIMDFKNE